MPTNPFSLAFPVSLDVVIVLVMKVAGLELSRVMVHLRPHGRWIARSCSVMKVLEIFNITPHLLSRKKGVTPPSELPLGVFAIRIYRDYFFFTLVL